MLHFTRIFFEILILAFVNTVKCPYWIADYMTAALFALNFEEKALVSAVWWWWSELLPPLGKWNILSRPYQKKKKKKAGRSRSFRSDTWPNLLSHYLLCSLKFLHERSKLCNISLSYWSFRGQPAIPNGHIAFCIATLSVHQLIW